MESKERVKKQGIVSEIEKKISDNGIFFAWKYHGLNSVDMAEWRMKFIKGNINNKVYKNRLVKIALTNLNKTELNDSLIGPNSFVFADQATYDPSILKELSKLVEKKDSPIKYTGGFIDGEYMDSKSLYDFLTLPTRDELLSMLLSAMQGVMRNLAYSLSQVEKQKIETEDQVEYKTEENKDDNKIEETEQVVLEK